MLSTGSPSIELVSICGQRICVQQENVRKWQSRLTQSQLFDLGEIFTTGMRWIPSQLA